MEEYVEAKTPVLTELDKSKDIGNPFRAEVLGILGRGIEETSVGFKPTSLVEKQVASEKSSRGVHSGKREHSIDPDEEDPRIVVAGANSNLYGALQFIEELHQSSNTPNAIVFAAGRPSYLKDTEQGISEGSVLSKRMEFLLKRSEIEGVESQIDANNQNTQDDVKSVLKYAKEKGFKRVALISIEPHIARVWEFTKKVLYEDPDLVGSLEEVRVIDSWAYLEKRGEKYVRLLDKLKSSDAYKRTVEAEKRGTKFLREGNY